MNDISKINVSDSVLLPKKTNIKPDKNNNVQENIHEEGIYPSAGLLRSINNIKPSAACNKNEQINQYLHSLPITGQVIRAYEQDEEGKIAISGLINTMAKNNVETSNAEMLIDLVENKKVHYSALLYFCNQGIMSDEYESDLDLLYDAYINNKDINETFVPTFKNENEGISGRKTGDVFQVEGQDNIFIKTNDNSSKQLKITRNTYLKLFPPLERFALYQGESGNCYMLSCLDAINSNPKTREKILSCFEENGDKLDISLPNSNYIFSMDKNKMPSEIKEYKELYSMGSAGFKILEHVYGKDVQNQLIHDAHEILKEQSQSAKGFFTRRMFKKQLIEFEKELAKNPDNIVIDRKISNQSVSWNNSIGVEWHKLDNITSDYKRASDYYRGRGGHEEWVMQRFGFENPKKIFDLQTENSEKIKDMLFNPENKDKFIFTAFSNGNGQNLGSEGLLNEDYGVYTKHSFSIKPKVDKNGNQLLHISNPWNSTQSTVMNYEKFSELFTAIVYAQV